MLAITRVMEQYLDPKTNPVISEKDNEKKRSQLNVSTSSQFERKLKLLRASRVDWRVGYTFTPGAVCIRLT